MSKMKVLLVALCSVLAVLVTSGEARATERITPGHALAISFDIMSTPWANQAEASDPNLIFVEFRGGVTFSPNAVVTATLFVDGVEIGSSTSDDNCTLCSSSTWQFAAPEFPNVSQFPNPTIVNFSLVGPGAHGVILLTVQSGFMVFGDPPYTENAPLVIFDNIAACGNGCISFGPVTMDAQNLSYEVLRGSP
jgi:hypothetical protein